MKTTKLLTILLTLLCILPAALAEENAGHARTEAASVCPDVQTDADDLLQAYIDQLSAAAQGSLTATPRYSGSRLTGHNAAAYNALLPLVAQVADGQQASTVFTLTLEELGLTETLTAADLGIHVIVDEGALTQEATDALNEYLAIDLSGILGALLYDCPYAMYWCDKTQPVSASGVPFAYDSCGVYFSADDTISFAFPVAAEYAADAFTFNTAVAAAVRTALASAADIVAQNAALSDADKLSAYRDAICSLTSYNDEAATGSIAYGNPWQLIWVFDGDPDTTVVCEGYSKAFQYLCSLTDFAGSVKCSSVTGWMDGGAHMWNLVRMPNDRVYLADITNSDSGTIGSSGQLFMAGYHSGDRDSGYVYRCSFGDSSYLDVCYQYDASSLALFTHAQLSVAPTAYEGDNQTAVDDGYVPEHWTATDNGVSCTITGYSGPGGAVVIPRQIGSLPVTAIADKVFAYNEDITSVVMRDGLVSIGTETFYDCPRLTSAVIPGSVLEMGDYIFQRCDALTEVTLGEGLPLLGRGMFADCTALASVDIPDTILTIGGSAFIRCTALTELTIPAGVTLIESTYFGYFDGCTALTAICVDESNTVYQSVGGALLSRDGTKLLCCPPGMSGVYTVPSAVTTLARGAFYGCTSLTEAILPEGLIAIGPDVFTECAALTRITIPSTVEWIGTEDFGSMSVNWGSVFAECTSLTEITVASGNERYSSIGGVLFFSELYEDGSLVLELTTYPAGLSASSFAIPEGVGRIGSGAFYAAANLKSLSIPGTVSTIRYNAFRGCTGLTSVTLPEGLAELGESVFYDCTGLKYVDFPDSVTSIGDSCFSGCTALTGILCSSGSHAAQWANENGYTILSGEFVSEGDWQAILQDGSCVITQYAGSASDLVIPGTIGGFPVTGIAGKVFQHHTGLVSVSIPDSVTSIGALAFAGCTSLSGIDLPDGLTAISESMLNGCTSLTSLTIPQSVTRIEGWSIQNCISLTSIAVPDNVTYIGNCAFHSCFALAEITLPGGLETLGNDVFCECKALESIVIPSGVTEIGLQIFDGCDLLTMYCASDSWAAQWALLNNFTRVVYLDEIWNAPVYEWAEDYSHVVAAITHRTDSSQNVTETVPVKVTVSKSPTETEAGELLYSAAFDSFLFSPQHITRPIPALGEMNLLQLPGSLTAIGDSAFENLPCQGVIIPAGCTQVNSRAFAGCTDLVYVKAPAGTVFAADAFEGCPAVAIDTAE